MRYLVLIIAMMLSACATNDYESYAKAQADVARAKSDSDTARYAALSKIAETGDASSKIAAVMALALGGGGQQQTQQVAAPQASNALQWASILVPSVTNIAGMAFNARVAMANADNNARIAESTNSAFLGIAGKIQAPAVIVPQANVTTTTTTNDNHATDSHNVATTTSDNHASTSTASTSTTSTTSSTSSSNTTNTTSTALSGAGVIGNGTYTASPVTTTSTANPVTTNNNPVTTTNPAGKTCSVTAAGSLFCL